MADQTFNLLHTLETRRDSYGFALRPQHAQRYKQYASIYKEEEEERSDKWKNFLDQLAVYTRPCSSGREHKEELRAEVTEQKVKINSERLGKGDDASDRQPITDDSTESDPKKEVQLPKETKAHKVQTWAQIRSSLGVLENIMSSMKDERITMGENHLQLIEKTRSPKAFEDLEEKVCVNNVLDESVNTSIAENSEKDGITESTDTSEAVENSGNGVSRSAHAQKEELAVSDGVSCNVDAAESEKYDSVDTSEAEDDGIHVGPFFSWKEELECLVRGGVPKDLRGEVWQAFVGVKARRVQAYYYDLLAQEGNTDESKDGNNLSGAANKWKRQIEDIPRT